MTAAPARTVSVTLVQSPACHFCEDAVVALAELAERFRFTLECHPATSAEGARLVAAHRPALSPLVLVDGEYFSAGRLPRRKLARLLTDLGATLEPAGVA